jgi:hypothetical protein
MSVYSEVPLLVQNTRIAWYNGTPSCQHYNWDWLVLMKRMTNSGLFPTWTHYLISTANQNTEFAKQKHQAALYARFQFSNELSSSVRHSSHAPLPSRSITLIKYFWEFLIWGSTRDY